MVDEQSPFCRNCGAPQIRVPSREIESYGTAPPPPASPALPNTFGISRVATWGAVEWKIFLRVALPLAALAGVFVAVQPLVAWVVVLPASVFVSIRIYSRRHPGWLAGAQGAGMGTVMALIVFVLSSMLFLVGARQDPSEYRGAVDNAIRSVQEIEARNPDAPRFSPALTGPHGPLLFTCLSLASLLVILLAIGSASGALTVVLSRKSR